MALVGLEQSRDSRGLPSESGQAQQAGAATQALKLAALVAGLDRDARRAVAELIQALDEL